MDRYNSCEAHVNSPCKRISFHINCIGRDRRFGPRPSLKSVVTALVLSNLDYCNAMLSGATAFQLGRLQRLQNRAARLITGVIDFLKRCVVRHHTTVLGQLCCYKQRPSHLRQPRDFSLQVPLHLTNGNIYP